MMGRTHVSTTTFTGSALLYGLYTTSQSVTVNPQLNLYATQLIDYIGVPFDKMGYIKFIIWMTLCLLALAFGALLPDVDSKSSILGRYVPWVQDTIGHRTFTHTIWMMAVLFGLAYYFNQFLLWMVVIGYLLHVLQDSFSKQGIQWLWPIKISRKNFNLRFYRVGGTLETVMYVGTIIGHIWCIWLWSQVVGVV